MDTVPQIKTESRNWGVYFQPDRDVWLPPPLADIQETEKIDFLALPIVEFTNETWEAIYAAILKEFNDIEEYRIAELIKIWNADHKYFTKGYRNMSRWSNILWVIEENMSSETLREGGWRTICDIFSQHKLDLGYQYAIFVSLSGCKVNYSKINDLHPGNPDLM